MRVLSLFDGISCGQLALNRVGITPDFYFASEIEKASIKVTQENFPNTIQIGDVTKVKFEDGMLFWEGGSAFVGEIDLLLAGSPCQGFSVAGKGLAFDDPRSALYFEFERLLKEINPKFWLLENVKMKVEHRDTISSRLGVQPISINSSLVSAQNRFRWYWTNISGIALPEDKNICLQDILEEEVEEKYFIKAGRLSWLQKFGEVKEKQGYVAFNPKKAKTLTVRPEPSWNTTYIVQWPHGSNKGGFRALDGKCPSMTTSSWEHNNLLLTNGMVRKLTPVECERLQTVPDNYTNCLSDSQRYKVLGNGWTVDVICHILEKM